MAEKMCPFLMMKHDEAFKCNCQGESCAWWMKLLEEGKIVRQGCAIVFIAAQKLPTIKEVK